MQETRDEVQRWSVMLLSKVTGALEASSSALSSLVSREVASLQRVASPLWQYIDGLEMRQ